MVCFSYHHNSTRKIAETFAKVLDAKIVTPQQVNTEELQGYDLVGFGSGIDTGRHYPALLDFADGLSQVEGKKAFIFSTAGVTGREKVAEDHSALREKLRCKGYVIVDEFGCLGFNTNSFLRFLGGMNKGRPNAEDIRSAEEFAQRLKQSL